MPFNTRASRPAAASPVKTETRPSAATHEGAPGFKRDARSELFLLALTYLGEGDTFYESADSRDGRLTGLVRQVATSDGGAKWLAGFSGWLRDDMNMRKAPVVIAVEGTRALLEAKLPGARQLVSASIQRADEPGEIIAAYRQRYPGTIPHPVKNGISDALPRVYSEYSLLKYDTDRALYRFGDVIELTHAIPHAPPSRGGFNEAISGTARQDALYRYAINRRHGRETDTRTGHAIPPQLEMVTAERLLRQEAATRPEVLLDTDRLKRAGFTWEDALSLAGSRVPKDKLWDALIPVMPFFALTRNLRNFEEAGISELSYQRAAERLADRHLVARSRMFPFRFLTAYRNSGMRWGWPLEQALQHSLQNIAVLPGDTLILVDRSLSMNGPISPPRGQRRARPAQQSDVPELSRADAAALFGTAIAMRAQQAGQPATLAEFANGSQEVHIRPSDSLLRVVNERFSTAGGGTETRKAIRAHLRPEHTRVILLTDEQAGYDGQAVLADISPAVPVYTWNLAGYELGHGTSGQDRRHVFGGMTDSAFRMIPLLESGRSQKWPWE
jgi:hypothetical protein